MLNSLLQTIKDKLGGGKPSKKAKPKVPKELDSQWAEAIAAMNAISQPSSSAPAPRPPAPPVDADEMPTIVSLNAPPLPGSSPPGSSPPGSSPPGSSPPGLSPRRTPEIPGRPDFSSPDPSGSGSSQPRISPRAEALVPALKQHPGMGNITASDCQEIKAYLLQRSALERDDRKDISLNLARRLKTTIGLEKLPQKMTADLFLEAIYVIYTAQA
ncbi:hypothetical protein [Prochlorothrix hollandica]|uniref:hypothetical protein n=1 Tax=Prochlorothrix hollandica TaxID=1223 RepID=UPI0033416E30